MEPQVSKCYKFGSFQVVLSERRLYNNDAMVLLAPKEFDLLLLLVQHSGQVIERERLIKALWPDTIVEEANLNVHISTLRKALAESKNGLHYIETLPRHGYRFIAPVMEVNEPERKNVGSVWGPIPNTDESLKEREGSPVENNSKAGKKEAEKSDWYLRHRLTAVTLPLWLLAIALIGILSVLFFKPYELTSSLGLETSPINLVPLTTYKGRESQASFSPDGNQIAFVWGGERDDNPDIYVRLVDGGNAVRLTDNPGNDVNPVWSADGHTIAFYRSASDGDGIFLASSLGGTERKLTSTWANRFGFGIHTWLHWSPDGNRIVYSDKTSSDEPFSLFLLSTKTGEKHRLTSPPASVIGDCSPAFSPDGRSIAFVRVISAAVGEIYLVSVDGGEPKQMTFDAAGASNLAWTPNGREIVFSSRYIGKSRLFRIPVKGGSPQWLAACGSDAQYPAFSRQGNRFAWTQNTDNADIFKLSFKTNNEKAPELSNLINSTAIEVSPRYSPDGSRIVFVSGRSGSDEIWVCGSQGENPVRLTAFRGPLVGSPSWSPDGKQIVFDCRPEGNADIFVINSDGGQPRRLTFDPAEDIVPAWSHDGRWIYFTSNRSGRLQVWKMPAEGGQAVQVTKLGGFEPFESPDGQWIYFTQDRGTSSIWRVPVSGGGETSFYDFHQKNYSRMWTIDNEGLYFADKLTSARVAIRYFNFSNGSVKTIAEIDGNLRSAVSGLTISPDSKSLLFPLVVQPGSDLMMIEDFH